MVEWLIVLGTVLLAVRWWREATMFRRWERACEEAHQAFDRFITEVHQSGWTATATRIQFDIAVAKWEALCRLRRMSVHEEHLLYLKNLKHRLEQAQTS